MAVLVVLVVAYAGLAWWLMTHQLLDAPHRAASQRFPTTTMGQASLLVLAIGVVLGPLATSVTVGAPFGVAAFVMAFVAISRNGDRAALLLIPLIGGPIMLATPALAWISN